MEAAYLGTGIPKSELGLETMIICASIEDTGLDIVSHISIAYHRAFEDELNVIVLR